MSTTADLRSARLLLPKATTWLASLQWPATGYLRPDFEAWLFDPRDGDAIAPEVQAAVMRLLELRGLIRATTAYGQPVILPPTTAKRRGRPNKVAEGLETPEGRKARYRFERQCGVILHHLHVCLRLDTDSTTEEAKREGPAALRALSRSVGRVGEREAVLDFMGRTYPLATIEALGRVLATADRVAEAPARPYRPATLERLLEALDAAGARGMAKTEAWRASGMQQPAFSKAWDALDLVMVGKTHGVGRGRSATLYALRKHVTDN